MPIGLKIHWLIPGISWLNMPCELNNSNKLKPVTNGGNTIKSINAAKGSTVDLAKYKPSRSGYYFVGWYRTKDLKSGTQVSVQSMKEKYADADGVIHVYAKWKKMDTTNPKTGDTIGLAVGVLALTTVLGAAVVTKKKRTR